MSLIAIKINSKNNIIKIKVIVNYKQINYKD